MAINIRAATVSDIHIIFSFIQQLAEYEKLAHAVIADESSLMETLFGDRPFAEVVIADYVDEIEPVSIAAGFALFFHNYSTFLAKPGLYLEDLFVLPEYRGKKIGKNLLQHLAQIAVERNCGRFEWSVLDWNQPAIEFYRSLGAVGLGDWTVQRVDGNALLKLAKID